MALESLLNRTITKLSRNEKLTPYLEKAIVEADWPKEYAIKVYNKERKWDGYFHPSSDAAAGELFLYYKFAQTNELKWERFSPSSVMTMQIGSALHSLIESMLAHLKFTSVEFCEVPFTNEENMCSGTLDVQRVFLRDGTGESPPVEIKSCSTLPQKVIEGHAYQLQPYLDMGCGEPADYGIVLYIEKAYPHRLKEFVVKRDPVVLDEIYSKWKRVREAVALKDPSLIQRNCCNAGSKAHFECPARFICRIGSPKPSGV